MYLLALVMPRNSAIDAKDGGGWRDQDLEYTGNCYKGQGDKDKEEAVFMVTK